MSSTSFRDKAVGVTVVVTDVDGVLTDGGMYYGEDGCESKKFNVRDGAGVALLRAAGLRVGAMTGERLDLIATRLKKIGMDFFYLGIKNKQACLMQALESLRCDARSVAYIGDEINDYLLLGQVGLFLTPADACLDLQARADHVLRAKGGEGVLREAAELILRERGTYEHALKTYVSGLHG